MCLNGGGMLFISRLRLDRGNHVRGEHPRGKVHLSTVHEKRAPVGACGNGCGFLIVQELVDKAFLFRFAAGHVCGVTHHVQDHGIGKASFSLVDLGLHFVPCVIGRGHLAHLVRVVATEQKRPALMDHDQAGRVRLDRISGAHDDAAAGHGHAVHDAG